MSNPVWIIDDDRSIRWVFEKALAREGIAHKTFSAAKEALEHLGEERPQVVVSDIRMPGLSGLEFMQQLKERLPATPVIIMTAYSDLESAPGNTCFTILLPAGDRDESAGTKAERKNGRAS